MWQTVKGGRRGRPQHSRPIICSSPAAEALPPRTILRDEPDSNESTQDVGGAGVQESMDVPQGGEDIAGPIKKQGRGAARGTQFERLRKVGKIPLVIKDGHRGPSCEHASIFTGRVTWIVKVYAELRHASWSSMPEEEKQELIDRVRADFVLDWTKDNVREMVTTHLSDKYNAYHYELHKVYKKYESHENALCGGPSMVDKPAWQWLCDMWASGAFKEKSQRNIMNRQKLKVKHTGGRKSFVRILEEKNLMVERLNEKDPDEDVDEAADAIFKDVLGYKSGYAQGMGHMVIPDPSPSMKKNKSFMRLVEENERHKSDAEMYKSKLDSMMGDIEAMRRGFSEYEKAINFRMSELEGNIESQRDA